MFWNTVDVKRGGTYCFSVLVSPVFFRVRSWCSARAGRSSSTSLTSSWATSRGRTGGSIRVRKILSISLKKGLQCPIQILRSRGSLYTRNIACLFYSPEKKIRKSYYSFSFSKRKKALYQLTPRDEKKSIFTFSFWGKKWPELMNLVVFLSSSPSPK